MAVKYNVITEDSPKNYLDFYLQSKKRIPISLNVRSLLVDLRDRTNDLGISFAAFEMATRFLDDLDKGELTGDDLRLESFINLIENYKQGRHSLRFMLVCILQMLDSYGDAIKNQAIYKKIDEAQRRREIEALIEVQQEEMARKRKAVEYLALQRKRRQLEQIPKNKRGKDDDTLRRLEFGLPLHEQKVKSAEIGRRWLIKEGQLTEDGSVKEGAEYRKLSSGELKAYLRREGAIFRQIFSKHRRTRTKA